MSDDWTQAWQPTVDVVGQDFSGGIESTAVDEIERATIRRYCEPLEFSCPLHYDEEVAKAHGYAGILAPHSGVSSTWIDIGLWRPGQGTRYPLAHPHVDIPQGARPGDAGAARAAHDGGLRHGHRDRVPRAARRRRPAHGKGPQADLLPAS